MNLMGFMSMLGNVWADTFKKNGQVYAGWEWVVDLFNYLDPILYAIMAVTAAAGVIYSVYLGINLARAEDQSKRDEAKKRLITTIIAVGVVVLLVIFFNVLLPKIVYAVAQPSALPGAKPQPPQQGGDGSGAGFIHI